ncbi:MAG TPA: AMIN domain-containing protein [Gemmatimonadaceae bacterium]|nr:AMIN domain-containing protein [Gemmatimonadaceae bacterium]
MKRVWSLAAPAALALTLGAPATARALSHGVLWTEAAVTPAGGAVRGISVVPAGGRAEVVVAVDGPVTVRDFTVENPFRVVLDIEGARLGVPPDVYDEVARGSIRNVRASQFDASTVRIVLDLDGPREYSVLHADGAIRVAVAGAADFTAWSSGTGVAAPAADPRLADAGAAAPAAPAAPAGPAARPSLFADDSLPASSPFTARGRAVGAAQPAQQPPVRITVTWENADIHEVLAGIAARTGRTIVTGKDVQGTVTAEIRDQPWDVALRAILNSQGLDASEDANGIITVDSYANILARQSSEPITTRLVQINYVPAASLVPTVKSLLSRDCRAAAAAAAEPGSASPQGNTDQCPTRGQVAADSSTNTLLISEVPSRMGELLNYVKALDIRTPQVSIKGKLISVNRSATEQLGLSYDLGSTQGFSNRLAPRLDDDGQPIGGDFVIQLGGNALVGIANADRKYGQNSAIGLIFSTMIGKFSLTSFLDALSEQRLSDVQAEPQATTMDNKKARIFVGQETPVRIIDYGSAGTGTQPRATVEFRQTGIILEVTPHITNNRQILMDVYAEQSELQIVGGDLGFIAPRRDVRTQVIVRDGETMALGGLTQTQITKIRSGIPILSELPLIGRLFSQTETREDKQDLLILLTPRILDEPGVPGQSR